MNFSFNETNQLVAVAANGGADAKPFTFSGKIVIDDNRDIAYTLLDEAGAETEQKIIVYGDLALVPGLDKLTIALAGGGTAEIQGNTFGPDSFALQRNPVAGLNWCSP